jgi:hypothetical protein
MTDMATQVDIDNLNLVVDESIEIDYNAPEPGSMPPRLIPGVYEFRFALEENEPFGETTWEKNGKHFCEVRHKAIITHTTEDGSQEDVELRFIRANNFVNDAMRKYKMQSSIANLIRSLNIRFDGPATWSMIKDELRLADGRSYGKLVLGWRARFPGTETVVSTSARTKKGEIAWPKKDNKQYELMATDPANGQKAYGRENVQTYLLRGDTVASSVNHDASEPEASEPAPF